MFSSGIPSQEHDPLTEAIKPPVNETPLERQVRLESEERAKQVSLAIDASLKAERLARRKKRVVRLLLLGQSESGKSTTLRQFQRLYTPTAFREERILWRAVIQLNLVRSVRTILDALATVPLPLPIPHMPNGSIITLHHPAPIHPPDYHSFATSPPGLLQHSPSPRLPYQSTPSPGVLEAFAIDEEGDIEGIDFGGGDSPVSPTRPLPSVNFATPSRRASPSRRSHHHVNANPQLEALIKRLQPLRHLEQLLIAKLVPPNEDEATSLPSSSNSFAEYHSHQRTTSFPGNTSDFDSSSSASASKPTSMLDKVHNTTWRTQEIFVRPGVSLKGAFARSKLFNSPLLSETCRAEPGSSIDSEKTLASSARPLSAGALDSESSMFEYAQGILNTHAADVHALWEDRAVREVLKKRKVKIEEGPGFFLDDVERMCSLKYSPTDSDVLRARLKTVGVSEYTFEMEAAAGRDAGTEWRIIDVGGSRNQRQTWIPYFDSVDAIIFLAPISAFDQVLTEDRTVNRLEDSVLLWKAVCQNILLANIELILFLNKCDILEAKLKTGIKLAKYIRSYGDRDNDVDSVAKYLRGKFNAIHREHSPNPRKFYAFSTSVTDTVTTGGIIAAVRDMVIRQHLKQSKLL